MKNIVGLIMLMFVFTSANAQEKAVKKVETINFQTSAICGSCKNRIEKEMNYTKGVIYSELDLETKVLTVKYKTKLLNPDKIKLAVSNIGYKADDIEPNKEAYNNLPGCCQKAGLCSD